MPVGKSQRLKVRRRGLSIVHMNLGIGGKAVCDHEWEPIPEYDNDYDRYYRCSRCEKTGKRRRHRPKDAIKPCIIKGGPHPTVHSTAGGKPSLSWYDRNEGE